MQFMWSITMCWTLTLLHLHVHDTGPTHKYNFTPVSNATVTYVTPLEEYMQNMNLSQWLIASIKYKTWQASRGMTDKKHCMQKIFTVVLLSTYKQHSSDMLHFMFSQHCCQKLKYSVMSCCSVVCVDRNVLTDSNVYISRSRQSYKNPWPWRHNTSSKYQELHI